MYMHAHLRYAQALAHIGEPSASSTRSARPTRSACARSCRAATLRQSNCYYSSSDATFADRYQASDEYERVRRGHDRISTAAGASIRAAPASCSAWSCANCFGLRLEAEALLIDPVLPPALDGLRVEAVLLGQRVRDPLPRARCGLRRRRLQLDGAALEFAEEANPYRRGAARVALSEDGGRRRRLSTAAARDRGGQPRRRGH